MRAQLSLGHGCLGSSIIFVDGGNVFDPYVIAEIAPRPRPGPKRSTEPIDRGEAIGKGGFEIHAGQTMQYLIENARSRSASERVRAAQLVESITRFDVDEYLDLLVSAGETLLPPFGYTKERVKIEAVLHEEQVLLH